MMLNMCSLMMLLRSTVHGRFAVMKLAMLRCTGNATVVPERLTVDAVTLPSSVSAFSCIHVGACASDDQALL